MCAHTRSNGTRTALLAVLLMKTEQKQSTTINMWHFYKSGILCDKKFDFKSTSVRLRYGIILEASKRRDNRADRVCGLGALFHTRLQHKYVRPFHTVQSS